MPRQATIYQVLIASPSDVDDERKSLREIIFDWNASHSVDMGILLEPVMWESHVYPDLGDDPQSIVNNQIVHNADVLVGIFWTRIGTKTKSANSGTVEEIQQIVESNKPALIYFSNKQTHPDQIDFEQYQSVKDFKNYCSKAGIINTYSENHEFRLKVSQNLSQLAFRLSSLNGDRNLANTSPDKKKKSPSSYSFEMDKKRLRVQADLLTDFDKNAINKAVSHLGKQKNIKALDVGCADGCVTSTRFSDFENISVLGIDLSKDAIKSAQNEFSSDLLNFEVHDIDASGFNIGTFDIIFCALTMHHLKNSEGTLHRLWAMLNSNGVLLVRGSDDGFKLNYPYDEDLEFLLRKTNNIRGSSDRLYGRKIYAHMVSLMPEPSEIHMEFDVHSTVGMNENQRIDYFDDNYSFRANYAKQLAEKSAPTKSDIDISDKFCEIIEHQKTRFKNESGLFSLNVQNIALAYKP